MARSVPKHKQTAPPGFCWIDQASELTGRTIETLYKDRKIQRRTGNCPGPKSVDLGRKAAWRIADIQAWLDGAQDIGPDAGRLHNSRPAEIAA